jgi:CHAT domain
LFTYHEFAIDIRRGSETKYGHRVTVECKKPDGGRVRPTDAQPDTSSIGRLLRGSAADTQIHLGDQLGQCMFPPPVLAAFQATLSGLPENTGLRIKLLCVDDEMARWPWELVRIEVPPRLRPRYLFRDERFSLVRTVIDDRPVDQPKNRRKLVILTVDATRVQDQAELVPDFPSSLPETVERFDLTHPTKQSIDEVIDQIADSDDPLDVFHFAGHGKPGRDGVAAALVLYRDQDTGSQHYRGDELAKQLQRAGTSLAFVNACYTDGRDAAGGEPGIAQSLTGIVPVVVAMREAVLDRDARDFAAAFYHWLLSGATVDEAVSRGRTALDESLPGWWHVVLYSRASSGRFLEPVTASPAAARDTRPVDPAAEGIRRWAMVSGAKGQWQLIPGDAGPELRPVRAGPEAYVSHLQGLNASVAISDDARVVAQLSQGRLTLAWVDRVLPRLDRWPEPYDLLPHARQGRLLAVAVDYGDEVKCLLSTDEATYLADVSPRAQPALTQILDTPTRCAAIVAGRTYAVDADGQLRGWTVNLHTHGIAEVSSIDAARSAGRAVFALAGRDEHGRPVVVENCSTGDIVTRAGVLADEVAVVRQLSAADAPAEVLLTAGGHIERIAAGGGA